MSLLYYVITAKSSLNATHVLNMIYWRKLIYMIYNSKLFSYLKNEGT